MTPYRTTALVLRIVEFGEADLIVHLLTPGQGRVAAMAKHARRSMKRFPGSLDLFNQLDVSLRPRRQAGMCLLERAQLVDPFLPLRADPGRYALGCYLVELLGRLAPEGGVGAEMQAIFDFAVQALGAVSRSTPDARLRVLIELRTLDALGFRPELRICVRCAAEVGGPGVLRFHVADGGVLCGECAGPGELLLQVHVGTLRVLEQALRFPLGGLERLNLSRQSLAEAEQIIGRFQRYHIGIELRSERFLAEALQSTPA